MKSYDTLKKLGSGLKKAAIVGVASYALCGGCAYTGNQAYANNSKQEITTPTTNLEIILEK